MKKLLRATQPPTEVETVGEKNPPKKGKYDFSYIDLIDILRQFEEMKNYNIAARIEEGMLQIAVGDSVYEVSEIKEGRYPRRRLHKLDT